MAQLNYKYQHDEDPRDLFDYEKTLERITPEMLQKAAQMYLSSFSPRKKKKK